MNGPIPVHGQTHAQPQGTGCTLKERGSQDLDPEPSPQPNSYPRDKRAMLTLVRTKAPLFVCVEVWGGSTPEEAICTAISGAGRVLFAQEGEGKGTHFSCRVAASHYGVN